MKKMIVRAAIVLAALIAVVILWNLLPASFRIPAALSAVVCLPAGWVARLVYDKYLK